MNKFIKNKVLIISVIASCMCLFVGCKPKGQSDFEKKTSALNEFNLPEKTSEDLELPTRIGGYDVVWLSNNPDIISNEGKVKQGFEDVTVLLVASISYNDEAVQRTYKIIVEKDLKLINAKNVLDKIVIPQVVSTDSIELPKKVDEFEIMWESNNTKVIKNDGKVIIGKEDVTVELTAIINYNEHIVEKTFVVVVKADPIYEVIFNVIDSVEIPTETYEDIELPTEVNGVSISWSSSRSSIITNTGVITRSIEDTMGVLTATYSYEGIKETKVYYITIKGATDSEKLALVMDDISFEENLYKNITLRNKYEYGIVARWESYNTDVLTNTGEYTYSENVSTVTLKLTLTLGSAEMTKEFVFNLREKFVVEKDHLIIERANELNQSNLVGLEFRDGKIILSDGNTEGTYTSDVIETSEFSSLVASWASTSSSNATVEVQVRAKVNGVWSDYISYRKWGLGLKNALDDQSNSLIKLVDDEVKVQNSKTADAIQYKFILRRDDITFESPKLSLVAFAIEIPNYVHEVDLSKYPSKIIYNVPKLYQQIVPTIGNSICSPTSSTMLLKYKGEDFSSFDQYEHRYIANLFKDYGNNIFGNWVYCTVGMGAYGYDAYVARYYSVEELVEHLAVVGPCAISVAGQMTSDKKDYKTAGHLLVAIGYEYDASGNLIIVCNDPNVSEVECRYTKAVIENTWRGVIYSID